MQARVRDIIPLGTPLVDAQRIMEHEGFKCTWKPSGLFVERASWQKNIAEHEKLPHLCCDRCDAEQIIMTTNWSIALVAKDGQVSDIIVSVFVDGP